MQRDVLSFAIQVKAGRALLGWSQAELAKRSGVARATVARIEALMMLPRLDTVGKLRQALREGGVLFHDDDFGNGFTISVSSDTVNRLLTVTGGVASLIITAEK